MTASRQKLYAYVHESGQDTRGSLFVVSVLVLASDRETVRQGLEHVERQSGKHSKKWHRARLRERQAHIEQVTHSPTTPCSVLRGVQWPDQVH